MSAPNATRFDSGAPDTLPDTHGQGTGARTLPEMVLRAGDRYRGAALRHRTNGRWEEVSYPRFTTIVREIAAGLLAVGLRRGETAAILANTRPDWTLVDMGILCAGGVVAPVYHTSSPEECGYVLRHSDARVVFCEDPAQVEKVRRIRSSCPRLEQVVLLEGAAPETITLSELRVRGAEIAGTQVDESVAAVSAEDIATIIYTSGTTGPPKGCILTHGNVLQATRAYEQRLQLVAPIVFFMFLPLAHALARVIEVASIDLGGTLVFWRGRPEALLDDIRETRPSYLPSVPRVFEKIHTAAHSGIADQPRYRREMFSWSIRTGARTRAAQRSGRRVPVWLRLRHRVADRLVLSKVRALFGGELRLAATGAAPIAPEVLEFFDACGVLVLEGWGMTETCAAGTMNTVDELRFGSVGRPLPGVEVRLAADGELLVRGPSVFQGYFKDAEATAEVLDGGWLATGDLASIDGDGFVRIVGRKKDLIITSSGKNISPSNIENQLKRSRWISEAIVFGDARPYLVALLSLDPDEAPALARELGADPDPAAMSRDQRVHAALQAEVDEANQCFARIEQVKRFALLDRELTQEAGELTPTMKLRRAVLQDEFADLVDGLYEDG